jgi:phosphopantetheinyl transferase
MSDNLYLEYGNIKDYHAATLESFSDEWCSSIVNENRRKESQLARLLLDKIIQETLKKTIHEVPLKKNKLGKPYLENYPNIFISITHSHGYVWVALCYSPIGIDFEKIDPDYTHDLKIAFNQADWKVLDGDHLQIYKYFSLKESYSKMTGTGFTKEPLSITINEVESNSFTHIFDVKNCKFVLTLIVKDLNTINCFKLKNFCDTTTL